jgi:predicted metal-binding protein
MNNPMWPSRKLIVGCIHHANFSHLYECLRYGKVIELIDCGDCSNSKKNILRKPMKKRKKKSLLDTAQLIDVDRPNY